MKVVIGSRCAWTLFNFRRRLARDLQDRGVEVLTAGARLEGYEDALASANIPFEHLPVPLRGVAPVEDFNLFLKFLALFRRERPDVVHMFTIKPVIYGTLAAAMAGVPRRVCTITGLGHAFTEAGPVVRGLVEMLYRWALSSAHVVFFQNADDRDLFVSRRIVDPGKVRMSPGSGVDVAHFAPPTGQRRPGPIRFLMLARLLREKGVVEFMEASEALMSAGDEASFTLVGAQDTRNPTGLSPSELARLAASPVDWRGATDDVRPFIAEADVIVLPSYREGTARVLLEAMAMGKPVVTTDVPGCANLVSPGTTGLIVPARDPGALAQAMREMIARRAALPTMGKAARAFVEKAYDEARVLELYANSYGLNASRPGEA